MDTQDNPADDLTKGKPLLALADFSFCSQGPLFFQQSAEHWSVKPEHATVVGSSELKGITFCCFMAMELNISIPDASQFSMWNELVETTQQACQDAQGVVVDLGHGQPISHCRCRDPTVEGVSSP